MGRGHEEGWTHFTGILAEKIKGLRGGAGTARAFSGPNKEGCMPNDKGRTSMGAKTEALARQFERKARDAKDTRRKERRAMTKYMTGTRKEWRAAPPGLVQAGEAATRR